MYWDARSEAESIATEPVWNSYARDYMHVHHVGTFLTGRWEDRNWLDVPGPFYGAETDSCLAGVPAAPGNVLCDERGMEFIWRQPKDREQLRAVLGAAYQDPFHGYAWDGDECWTPDLVLDWWNDRGRVDEWLAEATFSEFGSDREALLRAAGEYREYIARGLCGDLLRYTEWLSAPRA